ncbi:MAG: CPBP family intramembrane metalloprotease [Bdellovibrionales bacterium]|nr:CPBP family intramembrane metalloprotease [Bdellovibrionales bacterium]
MIATRRRQLGVTVWVVLLAVTTYVSWTGAERTPTAPPVDSEGVPAVPEEALLPSEDAVEPRAPTLSYEEKAFVLQAKMIFGAVLFLSDPQQGAASGRELAEEATASFGESLGTTPLRSGESAQLLPYLEVISAHALALPQALERTCARIPHAADSPLSPEVTRLVEGLCGPENRVGAELDAEQARLARTELDWFGELLIYTSARPSPSFDDAPGTLRTPAVRSFYVLLLAIFLGIPLFGVSLVGFSYFAAKFARGTLQRAFQPSQERPELFLEVFCLYLLAMLLLPKILEIAAPVAGMKTVLTANIVGILLCPLLLVWPRLWGLSWLALADRLGLRLGGAAQLLKDILVGPLAYFCSLSVFFILLVVYSFILSSFSVDPSSGAHPVVPILTQSGDNRAVLLVAILAVVVAPLVEELMFRGALYTWLRAHLNATGTIVVSSLLFAMLHPQGAVGVLPLTCIGMVLAFLREWRGRLTSCIAAHACFNAGTLIMILLLFGE